MLGTIPVSQGVDMNAAVPIDLSGKRILVTGAARGIGRAVAELAVSAGARVVATDVRAKDLDGLSDVTTVPFDLTDVAGLPGLVHRAGEALGGLDALVHVAGVILRRGSIDEVTEADWDLQADVNLKATFFLDRAVAAVLGRTGGGAIVNFASQGWWTGGFGGSVAYAATKGGVVSVSRGLARSLADRGVRVNVVAPGAVDTAMMREGMDDEARAAFVAQIPLGRMAEPVELAHAALFLVSDAASYLTGVTLNVSGGQLMY